jgi:hypothetical protein
MDKFSIRILNIRPWLELFNFRLMLANKIFINQKIERPYNIFCFWRRKILIKQFWMLETIGLNMSIQELNILFKSFSKQLENTNFNFMRKFLDFQQWNMVVNETSSIWKSANSSMNSFIASQDIGFATYPVILNHHQCSEIWIRWQWSRLWTLKLRILNNGVARWMVQPSCVWLLFTIRSQIWTWSVLLEKFPSMVAKMLTLCNFLAKEEIDGGNCSNRLESYI